MYQFLIIAYLFTFQEESNSQYKNNYFGLSKKGLIFLLLKLVNLIIGHLQVNGPKFDELKMTLTENSSINVFGICENWLSNESDGNLSIDGYRFELRDRQHDVKKKGEGVLLYIDESLNYNRRLDLECADIESIWNEICFPNSKPFIVCSLYRPPDSQFNWINKSEEEIQHLLGSDDTEIIIMGDFNYDFLKQVPKRWTIFFAIF